MGKENHSTHRVSSMRKGKKGDLQYKGNLHRRSCDPKYDGKMTAKYGKGKGGGKVVDPDQSGSGSVSSDRRRLPALGSSPEVAGPSSAPNSAWVALFLFLAFALYWVVRRRSGKVRRFGAGAYGTVDPQVGLLGDEEDHLRVD